MIVSARSNRAARHLHCRSARSFTLTELLVAMGIIAIIAGITAVGIRAIAREARLSSATNTVVSALDNARAIAIRENRHVAVVFRARLDGNRQHIEVVTAQWTRESPVITETGGGVHAVDRFIPVPGLAARRLPVGIKVAGPRYHSHSGMAGAQPTWCDHAQVFDEVWTTQTHLPSRPHEAAMRMLGILYAPDGTVVMRNASSDAIRFWVDFNNDGYQNVSECNDCNGQWNYTSGGNVSVADFRALMMLQGENDDEPYINVVPFLAIFDSDAARDHFDTSAWNDFELKDCEVTEWVNENSDRIHFNRFTGVAMR